MQGLKWPFLLRYVSRDTRHIDFPRVDGLSTDTPDLGRHTTSFPHDVCKLRRSLYGLKQAPRAWFEKFRSTLLSFSFTQSQYDSSLLLHTSTSGIVILLVYEDDIILIGTDNGLITKLQQRFHETFHMKDLGQLTYFVGLEVHYRSHGPFREPA